MSERNQTSEETGGSRMGMLPSRALILAVLLVLAGAAGLRVMGRRPVDDAIVGSWVGFTAAGDHVLYFFGADGAGFRSVADVPEPFRYEVLPGYPVFLRLHAVTGLDTLTYHGLLHASSSNQVQLEFAAPGQPAPSQLGPDALRLRRPASR